MSCGELWFGATPELEQQILEVSVVGEGGVGKSCITLRFTQNQFHHYYDPTIEDMHRQHVHLKEDGSSYRLNILDTAGEEEYMAMRHGWMEHKDGLLLVFSLASRESFLSLRSVYLLTLSLSLSPSLLHLESNPTFQTSTQPSKKQNRSICELHRPRGVATIIFGNKKDVIDRDPSLRQVSK